MESLKKLNRLEMGKNYEEYCKLADKLLEEKNELSPANALLIKKRRNFYHSRLNNRNLEDQKYRDIVNSLSDEDIEILKKCCPGIKKEKLGARNLERNKRLISQQILLNASITKNKYLSIDFDSAIDTFKNGKYFFFQLTLTSDFRMKRLGGSSPAAITSREAESQIINLDNEFMPIFIINANAGIDEINNLQIIHFPSLIPGGYHYCELVNEHSELNLIESLTKYVKKITNAENGRKLDCLVMKPHNQDIGIGYANEDFRKWITNVHGIKILKDHDPSSSNTILCLPQKAYPTISLIVNGLSNNIMSHNKDYAVDILIVNESDYAPLYTLQASFPKVLTKGGSNIDYMYPYLICNKTIEYQQNIQELTPICVYPGISKTPTSAYPILPSDIVNVTDEKELEKELFIIVNVYNAESIGEEFILSISRQLHVKMKKIIFICIDTNQQTLRNNLSKILKTWAISIDFEILNNTKKIDSIVCKDSHILFANENIVLQDLNILSMLQANLIKYNAFSSGCILSYLSGSKKQELYDNVSCGLYPTFNDFTQSGRITLEAKNLTSLLHPTEINVLSNHYDFCIYESNGILEGISGITLSTDIDLLLVQLSCQAVLDGKRNICSTRTSVQYMSYPTLNMTITLDLAITHKIISNYYNIRKYITNVKELMP